MYYGPRIKNGRGVDGSSGGLKEFDSLISSGLAKTRVKV